MIKLFARVYSNYYQFQTELEFGPFQTPQEVAETYDKNGFGNRFFVDCLIETDGVRKFYFPPPKPKKENKNAVV